MTLPGFPSFHLEFFEIAESFLVPEVTLIRLFVKYKIVHWPIQDARKQGLFLDDLRDLIENYRKQMPKELIRQVLVRMASLIEDCTPEIARQSLVFFRGRNHLACRSRER
jgi:hypothetical protein